MKRTYSLFYFILAGALSTFSWNSFAGLTDIAKTPLQPNALAKPNVIFGMDDSGSMDTEIMFNTSDGAFWWNTSTQTGWDATGTPLFNITAAGSPWQKLSYLFPNGCSVSTRRLCDDNDHYAVPPTPQFAFTRSSNYNPLFYNPLKTYSPWKPASMAGGALKFFADAPAATAPSHPLYATTFNLTQTVSSTQDDWIFYGFSGMTVPAGASYLNNSGKWIKVASSFTVGPNSAYTLSIPYFPASYWVKESCSVNGTTCVKAPDGNTLKLYEIKNGNTFPSGRTYADELQNFANWFTYYRKRRFMLAASMGTVLQSITGLRVGTVSFNARSAPTMYDLDSTASASNGLAVSGTFYANPASGGTPTRETLNYIGGQIKSNSAIVQYSCQKNNAFIVTDGFAYANKVIPPSYSSATYGAGAPFQTTYSGTLADIALSYYTSNLRPDLTAGKVPISTATGITADKNPNIHMNTYAITLGAKGVLWTGANNPDSTLSWTNPTSNASPYSIDDLWHATINGRGAMLTATDPASTVQSLQALLTKIVEQSSVPGGLTTATANLSGSNNLAYLGMYYPQGWSGDVTAFSVDPATGVLSTSKLWSAGELLTTRDYTTRKIGSTDGSAGVSFTAPYMESIVNPGNIYGSSSSLFNYLRGDRSQETTLYRARSGVMGPVVNAEPLVVKEDDTVYVAANDGMLHAFSATTGVENWAFVPRKAAMSLGSSSVRNWAYQSILDGSPVLGKVGATKVLVAGMGTAGSGYYALNVTSASASSDQAAGSKFMWEFPSTGASSTLKNNVGTSLNKPVFATLKEGTSALILTSGYNNSAGDGKGHLYVVNPLTGTVLKEIVTSAGSAGSPSGLSQPAVIKEMDGKVSYVYAGDTLGNLWKFDLSAGTVTLLAQLKDAAGNPQPITAAPDVAVANGRRIVYVGTGKLLGVSDLSDTSTQSLYAIWDNGTALSNPRAQLMPRTLAGGTGTNRTVAGDSMDWSTHKGWYLDLTPGEKIDTSPAIAYGALTFTSNSPNAAACESSSYLYAINALTGKAVTISGVEQPAGLYIPSSLSSRAVILKLSNGSVIATNRQGSISQKIRTLSDPLTLSARKTGWKEVSHD